MAQPLEVVDAGTLPADLTTVAALARQHLEARRRGRALLVRGVDPQLRALLVLVGLDGVLLGASPDRSAAHCTEHRGPARAGSLQVVGEAEEGEQLRAEEVRDARDPAVAHAQDVDRPRFPPGAAASRLVLGEGG